MTNTPASNTASRRKKPRAEVDLNQLVSEWQFAKIRYDRLSNNPELRLEWIIVLGLLVLVFAPAYQIWYRRWMLNGSMQAYAVFVLPISLIWCWFARYKLILPEVPPIRKYLRYERRTRVKEKKLGERDKTVLQFLITEKPVLDPRSSMLLILAILVDIPAFWFRDATLLGLGFALTVPGIIAYRHGWYVIQAAIYPLLMLFVMIPMPGVVQDALQDKIQPSVLSFAQHAMTNQGVQAEIPLEGEPLKITSKGVEYRLFAEKAGLGVSEIVLCMVLLVGYLSLVRMKHPAPKMIVVAGSLVWLVVLTGLRLVFLCSVAASDRDLAIFMEGISRFFLPIIGSVGCFLIARGLKCVKLHRWVAR